MFRVRYVFSILSMLIFLAGCQTQTTADAPARGAGQTIRVVATTTMITDLVEQIGGNHVEVTGLMGPGIDPHGYQATASDNTKLQQADVIVYNGLNLEGQMANVIEHLASSNKTVLAIAEGLDSQQLIKAESNGSAYDPHIWFDIQLWQAAADYVAAELSSYDPDHAAAYQQNNAAYQQELAQLNTVITEKVNTVPEAKRYLVTAHDAFAYFGRVYGFEVIGIQGMNTQTEAGTGDFSAVADLIAAQDINAVFVESSVSTRNIESLRDAVASRGHSVNIGGELYSDSLGDAAQNADTYIKMYQANVDQIVSALTDQKEE